MEKISEKHYYLVTLTYTIIKTCNQGKDKLSRGESCQKTERTLLT